MAKTVSTQHKTKLQFRHLIIATMYEIFPSCIKTLLCLAKLLYLLPSAFPELLTLLSELMFASMAFIIN